MTEVKDYTKRPTLVDKTEKYLDELLHELKERKPGEDLSALRTYRSRTLEELRKAIEALTLFAEKLNSAELRDYQLARDNFEKVFAKDSFEKLVKAVIGDLALDSYSSQEELDPYRLELARSSTMIATRVLRSLMVTTPMDQLHDIALQDIMKAIVWFEHIQRQHQKQQ